MLRVVQRRCLSALAPDSSLKEFPVDIAIRLVRATSILSFNQSIDLAFKLSVDPRRPNQQVRGNAQLPHGVGKRPIIAVFARGEQAEAARKAGADIVGVEDLLDKVKDGDIRFTKCLATPDMMPLLGKVARILGPKGLLPNMKAGTISADMGKLVSDALRGQVSFRAEKFGTLHGPVGRMDFSDEMLIENITAFVTAIKDHRPSGAPSGEFILSATLSATKGVGFRLDTELPPFKKPREK